ncbi:MAG: Hsp20/alpha crystallin family protein [Deltaproteobacteria bacterium]|nr:Hsp20/alpha crystallin family protein [Deltaproteobacteria bacterium]
MTKELAKREPFGEVSRLRREMDRLWEDFFGRGPRALRPWSEEWVPAVDVAEAADKVTVKAEVPGLDPKEIDISLVGDLLTIKGEKKSEREEKKENYHLVERSYGSFSRAIRLPAAVDADKIEARYDKGVLTVTCPKKEGVKPKAITIKTT